MDVEIPRLEQVLAKVDAFMARHSMAETRLGRDATGESSLITTMRDGRHPSLRTLIRLDEYMAEQDAKAKLASGDASSGNGEDISGSAAKALAATADAARRVA